MERSVWTVGLTRDECVENARHAYRVGRIADLVFAQNVKKLRDEFGLTQRQIAEEVNCSQPTIARALQALDSIYKGYTWQRPLTTRKSEVSKRSRALSTIIRLKREMENENATAS